jgi:hypothetical protein
MQCLNLEAKLLKDNIPALSEPSVQKKRFQDTYYPTYFGKKAMLSF